MKIILCGSGGKMGKMVAKTVKKLGFDEIVCGIDLSGTPSSDFPVFNTCAQVYTKADVIIDFSHPDNLEDLLCLTEKFSIPLIICTTGLSEAQLRKIKNASEKNPIFYSRNMSFSVNLMLELSKIAARAFGDDFDVEIIEKHHAQKIDSPSGTALMLAEAINSTNTEESKFVFDRSNKRVGRNKKEIGIHSVRGGTITGSHEVIFAGHHETLSILHRSESREIFATGALKAARFLLNKSPGLYVMSDML